MPKPTTRTGQRTRRPLRSAAAETLERRQLLAVNLVGDFNTFPADSYPSHFTPAGDEMYFFATDEAGRELWKTDGTPAGTTRVTDLNPGPANAVDPQALDGG